MDPDSSLVANGAGDLPDEVFKMIVDATAYPFVVINPDGYVRYASGSVEKVLGWSAAEVAGRNMVDFLPPDQVALAIEAIAEIDEVDREGAGVPMVFQLLRPDGSTSWVEIGAIPLLDVPGVDCIVLRERLWDSQHWFDEFLDALLADAPLDEVLAALCQSIAASLDSEGAVVHYRFDGSVFAGAAGFGAPVDQLPLDAGPWCDAASQNTPTNVDPADLPPAVGAAAVAMGLQACWTIPIEVSGVLAPAVLSVWRTAKGPPLIGHRHVLERSATYVRLALVRTAEHERLRHLAGHDALTGVANRAEFRDRLAHALAIGEKDLAVAFCDLDDFKPINDNYGHRVGDGVLVEMATRLRNSLRAGDELARIGGDEFTVLLRNVPDADTARHVAERLLGAARDPFVVVGDEAKVGLSVGIVLSQPGMSADALLELADEALYEVKHAGGRGANIAQAIRSLDGTDRDTPDDGGDPGLPA
jgi:diguanylate cyclase (GGDEF)-like protein/PAS domain S-box-containing protein